MSQKYQTEKVMKQDMAEITSKLSSVIIKHHKLQSGFDLVKRTMTDNEILVENKHAVIIGDSGCGKSSLMDLYQQTHCPKNIEFQLGARLDVPAIFSSVPSPVTPKAMSVELLKAVGDNSGLSQTSHALTERLIYHLNHSNVEVVFLDECQHLLSLGAKNKNLSISTRLRESLDWIKSLTNKTKATFVLMGMPELLDIIRADDQLARRFTNTHYLSPFDEPTQPESLLVAFTDELLLEASEIVLSTGPSPYFREIHYFCDNPDDARRLYLATGGNPSKVKTLVINAACIAYSEMSHEINMTHFTKAFQKLEEANLNAKKAAAEQQKLRERHAQKEVGKFQNPFTLGMEQLDFLLCEHAA
ncbi:TniB family NTP-binding protein [Methylophaga nitratireducenticrescens]|uniref:TniB protein n=1 Tax=Methylophaga nitratireducenticrescens TaxID=754476 RepID=I1XJV3_METNJ|nr:TniB family NTP-binding protein [Methylophaga nitratireducenticrescens]AFI84672.1 hypothetical protein Q7A_1854 [Methylophaga nitratireducenticrescens]AUZ84682.1 hypothetical protein CDW43_08865 [Methylophaga nitratireducenticrescens]